LQAVADLAWYDEEKGVLTLKAAGDNTVKVRRMQGQTRETIEARKVILDRKTGSLQVDGPGKLEGAGGVRAKPNSDVLVNVQEEKTGNLMFGQGVNSDSGLTGSITLNERNFDLCHPPTSQKNLSVGTTFQGAGQEFRIEAIPGTQVQRFNWWMGFTR
jgi:hypothetical protein